MSLKIVHTQVCALKPASKDGACHLGIFGEVVCDWKSSHPFELARRVKFPYQQRFCFATIHTASN